MHIGSQIIDFDKTRALVAGYKQGQVDLGRQDRQAGCGRQGDKSVRPGD